MGSTAGPNMRSCNWTALLPRFSSRPKPWPAGDVSAITPYLKALDRLDRYQTVASANQVYDDEARKKLMDKINRMAENFGINEEFAAAVKAHLEKTRRDPPGGVGRSRRAGSGSRGVARLHRRGERA